jgi:hypothetical protein
MAAGAKLLSIVLSWFLFLGSCAALAPTHLQTQQAGDLAARRIRRIAVMRASSVAESERKLTADEISAAFNRSLYLALAEFQDWQVVSEREIEEAQGALRSEMGEQERARRLGEMVHVDAVLFGKVLYFRERVGEERGVKTPASVAFALNLLDVKRGDIVWKAHFEETQRPLSENLFAITIFAERGARWLKAEELAQDGIKKAVRDLHGRLFP